MYDKSLLNDLLSDIIDATLKIEKRCCGINGSDDFLEYDKLLNNYMKLLKKI